MRKYIILLLVFSLFMSCVKKEKQAIDIQNTNNSVLKIGLAVSSGGLGDQSFNDIQYKGLMDAYQDFPIEITHLKTTSDSFDSYKETFIKLITEEKCNMIFSGGFEFANVINELSPLYPDVFFVLSDALVNFNPNTASLLYAQHEGSFMIGVIAALMTGTDSVAFIGGVNIPVIDEFYAGFYQGVQYINKDTKIIRQNVSVIPDFSGFSNPEKGFAMASDLYKSGVDIIYGAAGGTGSGIIEAAKQHKKFVMGVDTDQDHMAEGLVLTSMMKRLDIAIYDVIKKHLDKSFEWGDEYVYGYSNGGVSLSPMKYTKHLYSDEKIKKIREIEQLIINGEIKVLKTISLE